MERYVETEVAEEEDYGHWDAVDKIGEPRVESYSLGEAPIERIVLVIKHVVSAEKVYYTVRSYPN